MPIQKNPAIGAVCSHDVGKAWIRCRGIVDYPTFRAVSVVVMMMPEGWRWLVQAAMP